MEDLGISPWENQQPKTLTNFYLKRKKCPSRFQEIPFQKNRITYTESDQQVQHLSIKKRQNQSTNRQKNQSSSTHQNFYERKLSSSPSKLEIKLVSYPIQQKRDRRQSPARLSQKSQTFQQNKVINQTFEVIQTIFNTELKKIRFSKQRPGLQQKNILNKHFKKRFTSSDPFGNNDSISSLRNRTMQQVDNQDPKDGYILPYPKDYSNLESSQKENIKPYEKLLLRKRSISRKRFQKYHWTLKQPIQPYPQIQETIQNRIFSQKSRVYLDTKTILNNLNSREEHEKKVLQKSRKLSVQKLENINCFKENGNVFTNLKKKNKALFNELEKYNLFGLRNLRKKSKIK